MKDFKRLSYYHALTGISSRGDAFMGSLFPASGFHGRPSDFVLELTKETSGIHCCILSLVTSVAGRKGQWRY